MVTVILAQGDGCEEKDTVFILRILQKMVGKMLVKPLHESLTALFRGGRRIVVGHLPRLFCERRRCLRGAPL